MNEQKQREAMARLEGFTDQGCPTVWTKGEEMRWTHQLPTYNSHDDVQRVIDGLDNDTSYAYLDGLCLIVYTDDEWAKFNTLGGHDAIMVKCLKATPAQKREAALRAKGKWED